MVEFILRPLTDEDIRPLWQSCYADRDFVAVRAQMLGSLAWQEKGARVHLVVDVAGKGVVGAGHVGRYGRKAEIADVIVAETWRRCGLGSALVRELCDIATARAWRPLEIGVLTTNLGALRLYQRLGFRQVKIIQLANEKNALVLRQVNDEIDVLV